MTERLLQYIWQFQYFNPASLLTEEGEALQIIHPGIFNTNQGPDFTDAKIKIDNTIWVVVSNYTLTPQTGKIINIAAINITKM